MIIIDNKNITKKYHTNLLREISMTSIAGIIVSKNISPTNFLRHQWLPLVIIDYHWLSLITIDYHWLSLIIIDYHWLSLIIIDYHWLSLIIWKMSITDWPTDNLKSRDASASTKYFHVLLKNKILLVVLGSRGIFDPVAGTSWSCFMAFLLPHLTTARSCIDFFIAK